MKKEKKNNPSPLSRKEWWYLGGLTGLGIFYYVLLRWVILEKFCSPETIAWITKTRYTRRGSLLGMLVAFFTLATFFGISMLNEYLKKKRENKK